MQHWDELTIDNFSGPLDLLWNMVRDKKIDIQQIQLIEIVDQYLAYLNEQKKLDIEIASEYLFMASQLIELKSRKMLPSQDEEIEEEFQFEDLLDQITQFGQIQELNDFFYNKQEEYLSTFSKSKTKKSFSNSIGANDEQVEPLNIDLDDFANIFKNVIERSNEQDQDISFEDFWGDDDVFNPMQQEIISPQIIARSIVEVMKSNKHKRWKLEEVMVDYQYSLLNIICTFLAVLDLVKNQLATVNQNEHTLEFAFTNNVIEDESLLDKLKEEPENEQQY